ncbi:MAG: DNA primase [Pseudomonadota bacterium]|nr:DNA primase [Pseudomonadota bacterium]
MKFSKSLLADIKDKILISDVVGKKINLQKKGKEYLGLSPFQNEKTPSFTVNDEKQFYHCFSSNKHGDIFTFLVEVEGLSFPEAVEQLAELAGVELRSLTKAEEYKISLNNQLIDAVNVAKEFFISNLSQGNNSKVIEYINQRDISKNAVKIHGLGYAIDNYSGLKDFLKSKNISEEIMVSSGLVIKSEKKESQTYDRYRNRLMFPISNPMGKTVGFGGRVLDYNNQPKYMNSPETNIFHKGSLLYNFSNVKSQINKGDELLVVEGYMDVVSLFSRGIENVVASLGTAVTENQLDLLWKISDNPIFCFDGDEAGKKASKRVSDIALRKIKPGKTLKFINLDNDYDPDDYVRSKGIDSFKDLINNPTPMNKEIWNNVMDNSDVSTPEGKAGFETELREILSKISDNGIRKHYGIFFKESLDLLFSNQQPMIRRREPPISRIGSNFIKKSTIWKGAKLPSGLESLIISAILIFPEIIINQYDDLESAIIDHKGLKEIRDKIVTFYSREIEIDTDKLRKFISKDLASFLDNELKFSKNYWSKQENSNIEVISNLWLEILRDDQHIKGLEQELHLMDMNVSDEQEEERFVSLLEQKDIKIKSIAEKYDG